MAKNMWEGDLESESSSSRGCQYWDEEDTAIIEEFLDEYISMPSKIVIKGMFNGQERLYEIMMKEGWNRCYKKTRSIIRKKNKKNRTLKGQGGPGNHINITDEILATPSGDGARMIPSAW